MVGFARRKAKRYTRALSGAGLCSGKQSAEKKVWFGIGFDRIEGDRKWKIKKLKKVAVSLVGHVSKDARVSVKVQKTPK